MGDNRPSHVWPTSRCFPGIRVTLPQVFPGAVPGKAFPRVWSWNWAPGGSTAACSGRGVRWPGHCPKERMSVRHWEAFQRFFQPEQSLGPTSLARPTCAGLLCSWGFCRFLGLRSRVSCWAGPADLALSEAVMHLFTVAPAESRLLD